MINIIGGKFKRKKIEVPGELVRPTSAIKRAAIFSILESYALTNSFNLYKGKCFIDLFAGSGALGLEAISRGANISYFYEIEKKVINILKKNCNSICNINQFKIFEKDSALINKFNLDCSLSTIFIDPPYEYLFYEKILNNLAENNIIKKNTFIIIESSKNKLIKIPKKYIILKEKIYGNTKLIFLKKN